ncbi:alpha/beta hydrolase [Colwellia piezophila]|uniref:alpha/beta hydrolase n=1 Tax=Colwellia piezophila TaxID=211668 RepID=UPI0012FAEB1E|nr:alpha/beta hydrolase-fold protein [Colwellia piezophila]
MKVIMLMLFVISLLGCGHLQNKNEVDEAVWGNSLKGEYVGKSILKSKITGITYPYHIYLPASYQLNIDKNYPIIYVLDGQWNFKTFVNNIDGKNRGVIVVAIEEGPEGSDRRTIDYRLPGAMNYLEFFRQEFLPLIESTYRIDANNRSFNGVSFSGIIATALLFLDDHQQPLFKNYIAYDAPYWDKPKLMQDLIEKRLQIENRINSNLYLASAFPLGNHLVVMDFIENLEQFAIPGLNIHHEWYMVHHNNILSASIEDTLELIYGKIK